MIRLLRVELGRLLSRRLFRSVLIVGLLAVLAVDGLIAAKSSNNIAAAKARADVQFQQQYQQCVSSISTAPGGGPTQEDCNSMLPAAQLKSCLAAVAENNPNGPTAEDCRRTASFNPYFTDPRFHFADHAKDLLTSSTFLLMAVGLIVAASFVGAEWQAGTFASLLTWEPRRQRVMAAKLLAPVLAIAITGAVLMLILESGAALAAGTRGTLDLTTAHLMRQVAVMGARVLGLVALVTLIGGAIAVFTRHTVAVVGVVAGYLIAGEIVGGMASTWWHNHGLAAQLLAFIQGRFLYYVAPPRGVDPGTWRGERYLHAGWASVIVVVVAVTLVGVASATLSRRDVA
ncbi:MAG: type transport system permease protein [Frankiales bacterium]|jgi:ABC-2 type transport system permease protein|nr:type transport system permease protein [Frankiales bacterium]